MSGMYATTFAIRTANMPTAERVVRGDVGCWVLGPYPVNRAGLALQGSDCNLPIPQHHVTHAAKHLKIKTKFLRSVRRSFRENLKISFAAGQAK